MAASEDVAAKVAGAEKSGELSAPAAANIRRWLDEAPFAPYRDRLVQDIDAGRWKTLDDAFYAVLEFGTGGRRGKMYPVGTNVLNDRTISESARGLADYIVSKKGKDAAKSCAVARDTRHNSPEFAAICARVLAAAGFKVYLFADYRSTPLLSFATRYLRCDGGIMITASHNAPVDNGFKCYDEHGNQVVPPDDEGIIECVKAASDRDIPMKDYDEALKDGSIVLVGPEVDDAYVAAAVAQSVSDARDLSIVYTPMHGVGETSVVAALRKAGFSQVNVLESQRHPDGDFPNVPGHVSNPEIPKTLDASIQEARRTGAQLVLASDPDADRIGVGVPLTSDPKGEWTTLDGNQIGVCLAAFIMRQVKAANTLRPDQYMVTTLVSTEMTRALADRYGVRVEGDLLVGFKWIGKRIDEQGPAGFLFGFEESHGYLKGTYVRDKDAAVAALLFAELAASAKAAGRTVLEFLDDLYLEVGFYGESILNKTMEGREGAAQIKKIMEALAIGPAQDHRGPRRDGRLRLQDARDPRLRRLEETSPPARRRPADLPPGRARHAVRCASHQARSRRSSFTCSREPTRKGVDRSGLPAITAKTAATLDAIKADLEAYIAKVVG